MKKIGLFAIILFMILPMTKSTCERYTEEDILMGILHNLDVEFLEADINLGTQISKDFKDQRDMKKLSDEIIADLGIIGNEVHSNRDITSLKGKYYVRETISEEDFNQVSIYGYDKSKNAVSVVLTSYSYEDIGESETNLFINLIKQEKNLDISGIINSVYNKYGKPVDNTTCVIGTVEGRLDRHSLKENIQDTLKRYKGKIIEKYEDDDLISYTGFTPYIKHSMYSGEKRVNLNLAIRYNKYENKTYFWIATPIIATGY